MTMSTVFSIVSVIIGFALSMTATALLASALFPRWVARSRERVRRKPIRTFLIGLVLGGICILISGATSSGGGPLGFIGAILMAGILGFALCGSAGVALAIGEGLPSPADAERPWKAIIRGWVVLSLASLLPVLGWFFVLPIALLMGFGAALLSLFQRDPPCSPVRSSVTNAHDEPKAAGGVEWVERAAIGTEVESAR
jgi:hypothetical protein